MSKLGLSLSVLSGSILALACVACGPDAATTSSGAPSSSGAKPPPTKPSGSAADSAKPATTPSASASSSAAPAAAAGPKPAVRYEGFSPPESVIYDEVNDRYLVSNINGTPVAADDNGFISELTPDGGVKTLKWIEGGQNKAKLNAPKGLAISKGLLYVADLDAVRMFDLKTGAPKGDIKIEGATFLNDVATGEDGSLYVSDSGLKLENADFKPSGSDAVYAINDGKAKPVGKSADLGRPNGLLFSDAGLLVVTFGTGSIYTLDEKGARQKEQKLPKGSLDGIFEVGTDIFVSSWEAQTIYRSKLGDGSKFEWTPVLTGLQAPADIGFDKKRKRILVPRFMDNLVEVFELPAN